MLKEEVIRKIVEKYAQIIVLSDTEKESIYNDLNSINDLKQLIDIILKKMHALSKNEAFTDQVIRDVLELVWQLDPEDYKSVEEIKQRYETIDHDVPNSELIEEMLIEFNKLLSPLNFDCFFTGAAIMWIVNGHRSERSHSDLDLQINEEQLEALRQVIDRSNDFCFQSKMEKKTGDSEEPWKINENDHEYIIKYKNSSIGLFLFSRDQENRIILKEYYILDGKLICDEEHCSREFSALAFPDSIIEYQGTKFRCQNIAEIIRRKQLKGRRLDKNDIEAIARSVGPEKFNELLAVTEELKAAKQYNTSRRINLEYENSIIGRMEMRIS